ncbi:MAG: hypothetical protein PHD32_08720 [Eubacteriales bacterium]|nr:hypothetical protein [Eubacteriales bacterium]
MEDYWAHSSAKRKTPEDIIVFYEANPHTAMKYGNPPCGRPLKKSVDEPTYKKAMAQRTQGRRQVMRELEAYDACVMTGPTNITHLTGLPSLALWVRTEFQGGSSFTAHRNAGFWPPHRRSAIACPFVRPDYERLARPPSEPLASIPASCKAEPAFCDARYLP